MKNKTGGYFRRSGREGGVSENEPNYFGHHAVRYLDFSGPSQPYGREERPRTDPRAPVGAEKSMLCVDSRSPTTVIHKQCR